MKIQDTPFTKTEGKRTVLMFFSLHVTVAFYYIALSKVVMRDLRFAGYGRNLGKTGDRLSAVVSVHSDTTGFDLVAQVTTGVLAQGER